MIFYIVNHGKKVGSLSFYKMSSMFPKRTIDTCTIEEFEGMLLNSEWNG